MVYQQFIRQCVARSNLIDIICRPWATTVNHHLIAIKPAFPSWVCTVASRPFGEQRKNLTGRINGDMRVGNPGESYYSASKGSDGMAIFGTSQFDDDYMGKDDHHYIGEVGDADGFMTVSGFSLGLITELGNRASGGTIHSEWIIMAGCLQEQDQPFLPDHFW